MNLIRLYSAPATRIDFWIVALAIAILAALIAGYDRIVMGG